ncbi:hypothetical protein SCAR479_11370 [Seiridium cardinale]|uniref:Uncharacterized protein n=1 Tax=Seiridium cardinale TaxID=138064 RepID=A0ABR2XDM5_9PEZI
MRTRESTPQSRRQYASHNSISVSLFEAKIGFVSHRPSTVNFKRAVVAPERRSNRPISVERRERVSANASVVDATAEPLPGERHIVGSLCPVCRASLSKIPEIWETVGAGLETAKNQLDQNRLISTVRNLLTGSGTGLEDGIDVLLKTALKSFGGIRNDFTTTIWGFYTVFL